MAKKKKIKTEKEGLDMWKSATKADALSGIDMQSDVTAPQVQYAPIIIAIMLQTDLKQPAAVIPCRFDKLQNFDFIDVTDWIYDAVGAAKKQYPDSILRVLVNRNIVEFDRYMSLTNPEE